MQANEEPRLHIRVEPELKRKVGAAAKLEDLSMSEFVREELRGATEHIDLDQLTRAEP